MGPTSTAFGALPTALFADRTDAGRQLASLLLRYRDADPVVLALPRGGVIVGHEVACALRAPLDVIVARKLGAPGQPELGIGAVAPGGVLLVDQRTVQLIGISPGEIQRAAEMETREMERRISLYRGDRPPVPVRGRRVVLVDDGLATGVTARAAISSLRTQQPAAIVLAVPVCAAQTADAIRGEVDAIVCAAMPEEFWAVGYWYHNFDQTTDEEVIRTLEQARRQYEQPPRRSDAGERAVTVAVEERERNAA